MRRRDAAFILLIALSLAAVLFFLFTDSHTVSDLENRSLTVLPPFSFELALVLLSPLLVILAFADREMIVPALCSLVCTLATYGEYLSNRDFVLTQTERIIIAAVRLAVIIVLTKKCFAPDEPECKALNS